MQHSRLNRAMLQVADTTGLSGRVTAASTRRAQEVSAQIAALQAHVAELQTEVQALQAQLAALKLNNVSQLDPYVTVDPNPENGVNGPNIIFTGANIHIVSGSGATDDKGNRTGLGNLIIGYDEVPTPPLKPGDRGGSHNLVVGRSHTFTSSAFGGLIAGEQNTISSEGASVSGGYRNTASGTYSSVSGGGENTASGEGASVSGGGSNTASGEGASVLGGENNTASADKSIRPQPPFSP
jgi:outer membrane murein-binding lipoprotein Lpp